MDANALSVDLVAATPCSWEEQGMAVEYCCNYRCCALYHHSYALWCPIFINIISRGVFGLAPVPSVFLGTPSNRGKP